MANKPMAKMPVAERAKQFMPFAAVRGLNEALAKKERELGLIDKPELSEEKERELNDKLLLIKKGSIIAAEYYNDGERLKAEGRALEINETRRFLRIEDLKIPFETILDICIKDEFQ